MARPSCSSSRWKSLSSHTKGGRNQQAECAPSKSSSAALSPALTQTRFVISQSGRACLSPVNHSLTVQMNMLLNNSARQKIFASCCSSWSTDAKPRVHQQKLAPRSSHPCPESIFPGCTRCAFAHPKRRGHWRAELFARRFNRKDFPVRYRPATARQCTGRRSAPPAPSPPPRRTRTPSG